MGILPLPKDFSLLHPPYYPYKHQIPNNYFSDICNICTNFPHIIRPAFPLPAAGDYCFEEDNKAGG